MTITQTVEIPANHRLTIEVPREIPAGRAILAFTPASEEPCPLCAEYREPVTGELRLQDKVIASLEEADAIVRGEIPSPDYASFEAFLADLKT